MSDEDSQEECIISDKQNLAEKIQELCTEAPAGNSNLNEKLMDNISEEFSSKEELGNPVSN